LLAEAVKKKEELLKEVDQVRQDFLHKKSQN